MCVLEFLKIRYLRVLLVAGNTVCHSLTHTCIGEMPARFLAACMCTSNGSYEECRRSGWQLRHTCALFVYFIVVAIVSLLSAVPCQPSKMPQQTSRRCKLQTFQRITAVIMANLCTDVHIISIKNNLKHLLNSFCMLSTNTYPKLLLIKHIVTHTHCRISKFWLPKNSIYSYQNH